MHFPIVVKEHFIPQYFHFQQKQLFKKIIIRDKFYENDYSEIVSNIKNARPFIKSYSVLDPLH